MITSRSTTSTHHRVHRLVRMRCVRGLGEPPLRCRAIKAVLNAACRTGRTYPANHPLHQAISASLAGVLRKTEPVRGATSFPCCVCVIQPGRRARAGAIGAAIGMEVAPGGDAGEGERLPLFPMPDGSGAVPGHLPAEDDHRPRFPAVAIRAESRVQAVGIVERALRPQYPLTPHWSRQYRKGGTHDRSP